MHLRQEAPPLSGRDQLFFRSAYFPVKGVVDGDFCAQYTSLPPDEQKAIADELDRAPPESTRAPAKPKKGRPKRSPDRRRPTWDEQREFERMEEAILEAEAEVDRLEATVADPELASDHVTSAAAYADLSTAQERVKQLYTRWAELETICAG